VSAVPARPAGAGHYTLALAAALDARPDVKLTVVCRRGDDGRWAMLTPGADIVAEAPLRRPFRLAWEQTVLPVLLRRLPIDLYHSPHYTMPEATRVRQVVTIHDLTFFDHPEWHEKTKVPVFRRAIKVAARRADALICVSQHTAVRLQELLSPRAKASVVLHGVDHERFRPDPVPAGPGGPGDKEILRDLGVRQPFVAFIGTLEPRKAVDVLVQAFDRMAAAHPDLALVLAGGDGWGGAAIDQAIGSTRHRERIVRSGYVPDAAVPALLRQAAAVAYPAAEEGFGMPAIEALACEAPLVTTKGSVMEEIVGEAALLVPPGDVDALAGALDMLVRGDARLEERRALGRQIAAQHTWERCAEGHVDVYRSVCRSTGQ
jgi:glycosyltransferase involved in cell wall biosynthesis